ncbi:MAG TPA: DUF6600 domain-containing protein, partial [Anaeromyxobacteraceae bacterium]|nr:DUF6600 domain-containing protein [Anaeromyxobacteraceae bacterium]
DFREQLAPWGSWEQWASYGWVWRPRVAATWQPFARGRWAWTDRGWAWHTDEPWGSATYHYGRWAWHPQRGWVWFPGNVWAPAWVSWRRAPGYVAWAPIPPPRWPWPVYAVQVPAWRPYTPPVPVRAGFAFRVAPPRPAWRGW